MALTRHSVRTCFLWKDRPVFGRNTAEQRLWEALLACLEVLQTPDSGKAGATDAETVDGSVKKFLKQMLAQADNQTLAQRLSASLQEASASEILRAWRLVEGSEDAAQSLFSRAIDQGAAAYYLGQLAFLFGHLRLAKDYAVEAYAFFLRASREEGKADKSLPLRIFEFLTVTLLLEVSFQSEGYDTFRDEQKRPQARRIYRDLAENHQAYLRGFPHLEDLGLEVSNGRVSGSIEDYVENFWLPLPTEKDTGKLKVSYTKHDPLAFAYVLSRKNRAGMLYFRHQDWRSAEEEFGDVLKQIREVRKNGAWGPVLVPLEHEAQLFLGRIKAQACDFGKAEELIDEARRYFEGIRDEFAKNKALKARAELEYRRFRWPQAEAMFRQVSQMSVAKGFTHDWATAEMYLAKMQSGFGFQVRAAERLARINAHFSQYDILRETVECLFWHIAAEARRLDLSGHPRENVVNARALMKVYRRLFEAHQVVTDEDELLQSEKLSRLLEVLRDQRRPDVDEALLDLRLGYLPASSLVEKLEGMVKDQELERRWPRVKETMLINQLLRLIRLQQSEQPPEAGCKHQHGIAGNFHEKRLRKRMILDKVLSAFEWLVKGPEHKDSSCLALQEAHSSATALGLGGGLVPFLVDLSQFFIERDCFIASLLLLLDAVDEAIRTPVARDTRLDASVLKEVYRSLTKYLVLERNFYLGPPLFEGRNSPQLWRALEERYGRPEWRRRYESALRGSHGISYPDNAVGLGWVGSLDTGGATLRIAWVDDYLGSKLQMEAFRHLQVPQEVVAQGHAEESMSPVVLVGRNGAGGDHWPWTAHRIPIDFGGLELFRDLPGSPWYEPVVESWQYLFERFTGQVPATCESPRLSAEDEAMIEEGYAHFARAWFAERFPPEEFKRIFGVDPGPLEAPARDDKPLSPNKARKQWVQSVLSDFPSQRPPESIEDWEPLIAFHTANSAGLAPAGVPHPTGID